MKRRGKTGSSGKGHAGLQNKKTPSAALKRERDEALQQQAATAEILRVISSSPADTQPVFEAIVQSGLKLFPDAAILIALPDGDRLRAAAYAETNPARVKAMLSVWPIPLTREYNQAIAILDRKMVDIPDGREAPSEFASGARYFLTTGYRAITIMPMMRGREAIGTLSVVRVAPGPLSKRQIGVLKTFAAQAVIAIENTRLLNELRQRTDDLSESLEQQTATSEVLKVISSSRGKPEPVFEAMLENATRICEAKYGIMLLHENGTFRTGALCGVPPELAEERQRNPGGLRPPPKTGVGIVVRTKRTAQIADILAEPEYFDVPSGFTKPAIVQYHGARTELAVPMLKEGELVGVIVIYRTEVRLFSDKQIELVTNFAAQAVIAIENTRLLNELRQRTNDLTESLEQQTATSEVLQIISKSPGELESVFEAMLGNAVRICGAKFGNMWLRDGDGFRVGAMYGTPQAYADFVRREGVFHFEPRAGLGTVVRTKQPFQFEDVAAAPTYGDKARQAIADLAGARTLIGVPMLKDDEVIGAIGVYRQEVRPFTEKQIEVVKNFASQAVIAIENARLLNELRESLQQQTATADVLKVISRSTFDLKTVLTNLVETAVRVCEADIGNIARPIDGDTYKIEANYGQSTALYEELARQTLKIGKGSVIGRTALSRAPVHILDAQTDPDYELRAAREIGDYHTMLGIPMVREGNIIGVFGLARSTVRAFTEKQIELVTTFADQAVIAIENVRLFESVETRTRELAKSLEELRTTQDRLVQTQKLASLGQLTAGIAHEMKNPLNFVNNFSGVSSELIDELQQSLKDVNLDDDKRGEVTELMETLRGNLDKVVQHGKRADAIVKNMLQHSREGIGEHRPVDINALVEESLNLAWHGARAEKQGFEITLKQSFDPSAGEVDVFPQDIRRALLNLISNGFYAATKRMEAANGGDYDPVIIASTKNLGDRVEIRIHDNGIGIAPDVKDKMFNPFFTTKPTGEGTGLGLSISHDIIVKQHAGSIDVDTQPGAFTEITVILLRTAVFV
jgi:two-component system, NtrC family, sensor kinase